MCACAVARVCERERERERERESWGARTLKYQISRCFKPALSGAGGERDNPIRKFRVILICLMGSIWY